VEGLRKTVSHTTRKIRPGEKDGVDYHFTDEAGFGAMLQRVEFIEWAKVYGSYYGTSAMEIKNALSRGDDLLLVIDVQGGEHVRNMKNLFSRSIFLLPPTVEELKNRLVKRGTDSPESIKMRMESAKDEMECRGLFDHQVVNDNLDEAVEQVRGIILEERRKRRLG
jgi:guanylate kinase